MQSDALRELLAAASPNWRAVTWGKQAGLLWCDDRPFFLHSETDVRLAALASALAQEVLDLRAAGDALAERLNGESLHSIMFDLCLAQPCVENRIALVRWAELTETEVRGGRD